MVSFRFVALSLAFLGLGACARVDVVAVQNATEAPLTVRAEVDEWFDAYECFSGDRRGSTNSAGTYDIAAGEALCLRPESRKDEFDAEDYLRRITVLREGERCLIADTDTIRSRLERDRGISFFEVSEELCPSPNAQVPSAAQQPAPQDDAASAMDETSE